MQLDVNDEKREVFGDPERPLLWVLRDELNLTGTKYGCGVAQCGACTVLVDGEPSLACQVPVEAVENSKVVTIEGAQGAEVDALRAAWIELDVPQCGYCQSGQIIVAAHLLSTNTAPTDEDIDDALSGNLCRCATYHRIRQGVHLAAQRLRG
ncbi:(2Fe-2S)-binding protein [Ruegeria pomeroyi]|uniref:(2Fe-2S)-binding protein n=1 Tax=Ruegeria pomeroyi TaxID=89184 RepID=UPI001F347AB7|nr:(2Fe-2S)-binding protein [Ruegeria pomeroyi]MCE8510941.1 (2Fe-2S)-binding protein [Ruegeria pomeroyi]